MHDYKLLIGGAFVDGAGSIDVVNPATEQTIARCPVANEAQLNQAVAAAKAAFPAWSALPLSARAKLIDAVADRLFERQDEFARLLTVAAAAPSRSVDMNISSSRFNASTTVTGITPTLIRYDGTEAVSSVWLIKSVATGLAPNQTTELG